METIYQFAEAFNKKQLRRIKKLLTPDEYKVMSVLHLTDGEASERTGIAPANIPYFMKRAWDKLGTENRLSTALYLLKHGMKFDIERPADDVRFTLRERDVADRLELRNQDIAHDLDLSLDQVKATITSLRSKTGAKTRTELALISHMFPLKLAEEEAKLPEILREFTPRQREVLQRLHLGLEEIAHQLDISPQAVRHLVDRVKDKTGHTNTVELALELQRNGVRYAIRKPKQPLVELWDSRDMEIVSSLGPPNKDIAESLDLPPQEVRDRIAEMQVKTRARTKVELALIMAAFDTGERRAPEPRPGDIELSPRDKLAAKLGYKTLSTAEVSLLLQQVRPRERRALAMYHDRDEPITWREASEQLEIEGYSTARSAASAGIARIRRLGIRLVAQAESPGQEPDEDEPLLAQGA
jgi:DNA-binding NarL/FixJ family response regulator